MPVGRVLFSNGKRHSNKPQISRQNSNRSLYSYKGDDSSSSASTWGDTSITKKKAIAKKPKSILRKKSKNSMRAIIAARKAAKQLKKMRDERNKRKSDSVNSKKKSMAAMILEAAKEMKKAKKEEEKAPTRAPYVGQYFEARKRKNPRSDIRIQTEPEVLTTNIQTGMVNDTLGSVIALQDKAEERRVTRGDYIMVPTNIQWKSVNSVASSSGYASDYGTSSGYCSEWEEFEIRPAKKRRTIRYSTRRSHAPRSVNVHIDRLTQVWTNALGLGYGDYDTRRKSSRHYDRDRRQTRYRDKSRMYRHETNKRYGNKRRNVNDYGAKYNYDPYHGNIRHEKKRTDTVHYDLY